MLTLPTEVVPENHHLPTRHERYGRQELALRFSPQAIAAREEGGAGDPLPNPDKSVRVLESLQPAEEAFDWVGVQFAFHRSSI